MVKDLISFEKDDSGERKEDRIIHLKPDATSKEEVFTLSVLQGELERNEVTITSLIERNKWLVSRINSAKTFLNV